MTPGCYYIRIKPVKPVDFVQYYHGTLRVEERLVEGIRTLRASGDIYSRPYGELSEGLQKEIEQVGLNPRVWPDLKEIPAFPRSQYYGYMEESPILEGKTDKGSFDRTFSARFRFHQFDQKTNEFTPRGFLTLVASEKRPDKDLRKRNSEEGEAKNGKGSECRDFDGKIINDETGVVVDAVELRWVSPFLRKAVVEIDAIASAPIPKNNGLPEKEPNYVDWKKLFARADWDVEIDQHKVESKKLEGVKPDLDTGWTDSELHAAMLALRRRNGLDFEWRYQLLCVGIFANPLYERGVMYDVAGVDTDAAPREGAAIAANWPIPEEVATPKTPSPAVRKQQVLLGKLEEPDPAEKERAEDWQVVRDAVAKKAAARGTEPVETFGRATDVYFRTAVHEIGHAMGLEHSREGTGFLTPTDTIARLGTESANELLKQVKEFHLDEDADVTRAEKQRRFPNNIEWSFSESDLNRLRHGPDAMVRPGAFNARDLEAFADDTPVEFADMELQVSPLLAAVTFGAPVRINLRLGNGSEQAQMAPYSLHLKSGFVSGTVIDPNGNSQQFDAVMRPIDTDRSKLGALESGKCRRDSATLLHGNLGPLFPTEGVYGVKMQVAWNRNGKDVMVAGSTTVTITPPANLAQRLAARRMLAAPRALFALAIGGTQDAETEAALTMCLADPFLGPHYRIIEIKRIITTQAQSGALAAKIDNSILSISEINRVENLLDNPYSPEQLKEARESLKKQKEIRDKAELDDSAKWPEQT